MEDPLSLNLYVYCANNPIIYIDPSGNGWLKDFISGIVVGIGDSLSFGIVSETTAQQIYTKNNVAYISGKFVAEVGMIIVGGIMTGGGTIGGVVTSPTGVGAVAGAGIAVAGAGIIVSATESAIEDAIILGAMLSETIKGGNSDSSNNNERSTKEKIEDIENNPDDWTQTNESVVESTNKKNKGGLSIEKEYTNVKTNEKIYEHSILDKNGEIFDAPHYRPYPKQIIK